MRYLSVIAIIVSVFFVSKVVPQANDERFYLINSTWALLIILSIVNLQRSSIIFALCVAECLHMIVNLVTAIDYINGGGYPYKVYPTIINSLNAIEAVILFIGVPWGGVFSGFSKFISHFPFDNKHYNRVLPGNKPMDTKTKIE